MAKKLISVLAKHAGITAGFVVAIAVIASLGLSWIATCGVIKLITLCFGWTFSWAIATGVWLVMCLARTVFKSTTTVKK
jgi:hypothetical protein